MKRANITWIILALLCATQLTLGDPAEIAPKQQAAIQAASRASQDEGFWPMNPQQCAGYRAGEQCLYLKCLCFSSCNIVQAGFFIGFDTAHVRECEQQFITCQSERKGGF